MTHLKWILTRFYLCLAVLGFALNPSLAQGLDEPLIRNNLQVKAILKEESPIYSEPSTRSKEVDKANQFSILFVFQPDSSSGMTQNGFYRVGKGPRQTIGWIHESRVELWDHRECVRFTPLSGREPTQVYGSLSDLKAALRLGNPSGVKPIASEPGETSELPFAMLLPVLSKQTVSVGSQVHTALEIAYLANETGSQRGSAGRNPSPQTPYLDILFVMDTTLSMRPYIEKTKDIIDEIARKALGMREGGVRIGLRCYRDYGDPDYVTQSFSDLTPDFRTVKRILDREVHAGPNTVGIPEAVFDGLYAGITETNWSEGTGLRVIVLVGDASSNPVGDPNNPNHYDEAKLVALASQNRVRIIALKIVSHFDSDNLIHKNQLKTVAQGKEAGDRGSYHEIEISPSMTSTYVEQVASEVEVEIALMAKLIEAQKDSNPLDDLSRSERAIILKNLLPTKHRLAPPEFSNGWISDRNPHGELQTKPYVFLSFDDLELTLFYMRAAMTLASTTTSQAVTALLVTISSETGEELEKERPIKAQYEKRLGLPFPGQTLAFTLDEILAWGESRRNDLTENINRKIKLLETHKADPSVWYTTEGIFKYTFVPLDYFP
ncbi:VWA domain-containing protein [Candidatus Peregrinibacteria bacterium]|nr:VWA domain-containing protein [Candidatus Peregrinibacteria bacterium]